MSDAETSKDLKDCEEDSKASQADASKLVQTVSQEDFLKRHVDKQGITINFYSTKYAPTKTDKPVQTEPSCQELEPCLPKTTKQKKVTCPASESREIRSFDYTPVSCKKPSVTSHAPRQNKLMTTRKFTDGKPVARPISDLERKKLEAELKATEEIAKIQQAVIEKRLALELASLQDGNDYHHKSPITPKLSTNHAEQRIKQEASRKHSFQIEKDQDWTSTVPRKPPQPQPPPPPPRAPPASMPSCEGVKMINLKSDSSFLKQNSAELNPLRHFIEKKINLDRRSSRTSETKFSPSPTRSNSHDRRLNYPSPDARYRKTPKNYPPPDQPSCSSRNSRRARVLWKSAMKKIKKKMKHGSKGFER